MTEAPSTPRPAAGRPPLPALFLPPASPVGGASSQRWALATPTGAPRTPLSRRESLLLTAEREENQDRALRAAVLHASLAKAAAERRLQTRANAAAERGLSAASAALKSRAAAAAAAAAFRKHAHVFVLHHSRWDDDSSSDDDEE